MTIVDRRIRNMLRLAAGTVALCAIALSLKLYFTCRSANDAFNRIRADGGAVDIMQHGWLRTRRALGLEFLPWVDEVAAARVRFTPGGQVRAADLEWVSQAADLQIDVLEADDREWNAIKESAGLKGLRVRRVPGDWDGLSELRRLTALSVEDDEGARHLCREIAMMPVLEELSLEGSDFTDTCLAEVCANHSLEMIILKNTSVTDEGLDCLVELPALNHLVIRGATFTDAAIEHVSKVNSLRSISVRGTAISDEALARLSAIRPDVVILRRSPT